MASLRDMTDEAPDESDDEPPDEHITDPYYGDEMQPLPGD